MENNEDIKFAQDMKADGQPYALRAKKKYEQLSLEERLEVDSFIKRLNGKIGMDKEDG